MENSVEDKSPIDNSLESTTALQQSKEILRATKPSENISINNPTNLVEETPEIILPEDPENTETVFEKLEINSNSDSAIIDDATKTTNSDEVKKRPIDRNKSDIFSLDDKIKSANRIFSVNGTPSGRITRRRDEYSEVFPVGCMGCKEHIVNTPQKIAVKESKSYPVAESFTHRNPVTGAGVDSLDEVKKNTNAGRRRGHFF